MITLISLWMPIVVSAVGVFFASSLIHMVLRWHQSEYRKIPNDEAVRTAIRQGGLTPGQYVTPYCPGGKEMRAPETQQQFAEGPVATLIVRPNGMPRLGGTLGQWFLFNLAVSTAAASLGCMVLGRGADLHQVFHFFGLLGFMTYVGGSFINGIWMGRLWSAVAKDVLDSLIYAAVMGATFAWLWP